MNPLVAIAQNGLVAGQSPAKSTNQIKCFQPATREPIKCRHNCRHRYVLYPFRYRALAEICWTICFSILQALTIRAALSSTACPFVGSGRRVDVFDQIDRAGGAADMFELGDVIEAR